MPGRQMPETGELFSFDKIAHLGVFCILNFLMIIGLSKQFTFISLRKNAVSYGTVLSALYAGILELGQSIIPERSSNAADMAFNLAGVFFGFLIFFLVYKFSNV
jgi:VanZ family protein